MKRIVPVSGGKDSQAVLSMVTAEFGTTDVVAVHQNTGYDHPLTYDHLRYMEDRYRVPIIHTRSAKYEDIFDFIEKDKFFPTGLTRACTKYLKQIPFRDWMLTNDFNRPDSAIVYLGMRADESNARADRYGDITPDDEFFLSDISPIYRRLSTIPVKLPVVNWSTDDIFGYLRATNDKINELYSKGHKRVGCYPCLLSRNEDWRIAARDSVGRQHIRRLIAIEDDFKERGIGAVIHKTRDVRALLRDADAELGPDADAGCGWCSI